MEYIPIRNHPDFEINFEGKIRRVSTKEPLKGSYDRDGYIRVQLNYKQYRWHRLVAEHFVPNPENKSEVNHINHKRDDNRAVNLNWMTSLEQYNHSLLNEGNGQRKRIKIKQFDLENNFIAEYDSITQACREVYGNSRKNSGNISRCIKSNLLSEDKDHQCGGYIWRKSL